MKPLDKRLFDAIGRGDLDTVRLLLSRGADVSIRDGNSWGPLDHACGDGLTDIVRLLLEYGADVNANNNDFHLVPLHWACKSGNTDVVRLLLEVGADLTVRNSFGKTPLDQVLSLPSDNPAREWILDLFREFHPELVMEVYCSPDPGQMR